MTWFKLLTLNNRAHRRPDQRSQLKLAAVTGDEAFRPAQILRQPDAASQRPRTLINSSRGDVFMNRKTNGINYINI
jgi:hypothetical protein